MTVYVTGDIHGGLDMQKLRDWELGDSLTSDDYLIVAGDFGFPWNFLEPPICVLKIDGQKIVLSHYPMADWQGMSHGSWHLHGHIHSSGGAYNEFNRKQGLLRYDVGCDANGHSPVSLDELREWFAGVDEPCGRVKWPWWVNETGDRQVERELAAYKREAAIR